MKAKKIISIILTGVVTAGLLTGCGSSSSKTDNTESASQNETAASSDSETAEATETPEAADAESTETPTPSETEEPSETAADDTEDSGKTLVVYYSATGTTAGVAQTIADATGGDLFELVPTEPYSDDDLDWTDNDSRVSREHDDESLRDVDLVSTSVDNWDSYDTVFIGYPIWWGIAAWPVDTFVKANDFTDKNVIPFCTAASSGIGDSGNLLEEMAGTGNWLEGERLNRGVSVEEIQDWVDGMELK